MTLSEKLLYCRKKNGLSQDKLAEIIGVSRQAVSKWENGESEPELSKLRLLAACFRVSPGWLLSEEEPAAESAAPASDPSDTAKAAQDAQQSQQPAAPQQGYDPFAGVPGMIGTLLRRYGWFAGVYIAVSGGLIAFIGFIARTMANRMSSAGFSGLYLPQEPGPDVFPAPILADMPPNPVAIMGSFIMGLGLVMLAAGIIMAIVLKKKYPDA